MTACAGPTAGVVKANQGKCASAGNWHAAGTVEAGLLEGAFVAWAPEKLPVLRKNLTIGEAIIASRD
jgi:hypothetical protein